jgi:hypothetical protein
MVLLNNIIISHIKLKTGIAPQVGIALMTPQAHHWFIAWIYFAIFFMQLWG